jgi:hypothetical protein
MAITNEALEPGVEIILNSPKKNLCNKSFSVIHRKCGKGTKSEVIFDKLKLDLQLTSSKEENNDITANTKQYF